jgi:cellulose synthase/poly-beta-1,6-N-acetylglucosamine synthase-like glycosyltransferase
MFWITAALTAAALLVAWPALVVAVQVIVAVLPFGRRAPGQTGPLPDQTAQRPGAAVLVPAHNEALGIRGTIEALFSQLSPGDRLVVIADNCSDETAQIARECGADVLERFDEERRGKGYALQAGLTHLEARQPPDFVVVVDADCRLREGCLDSLVAQAARSGRPVQGCYLMTPPSAPRPVDVVSALAVLVKNRVRPLALARLGLPCLITGSGAIFPGAALQARAFDGGNIVEDMQLAVDLAIAGFSPSYCDDAMLTAALPDQPAAFVSQRRRWEHGHLRTLSTQVPRLGLAFLRTGRVGLLAMLVDLAVPPLSLLVGLNLLVAVVGLLAGGFGVSWAPLAVSAVALGMLAGSIGLAWWCFARAWMPLRHLLSVPVYVLGKLPLYAQFVFRRERAWVRTARSSHTTSE